MYHAGNLGFCLGFDWQTVASVAHGDHSVLQIASGCAVVDHVVHLFQPLARAVNIEGAVALEQVGQVRFHDGFGLIGLAFIAHDGDVAAGHGRIGKAHCDGVGQVDAVIVRALLHGGVVHLGVQHAHDAELIIESSIEKGTTVWVRF